MDRGVSGQYLSSSNWNAQSHSAASRNESVDIDGFQIAAPCLARPCIACLSSRLLFVEKNALHVSDAGEDKILYCDGCDWAQNSEITKLKAGDNCPKCGLPAKEGKSIEVGNIFNFGSKYAKDMNGYVNDEKGEKQPVLMASYGIGISRLVATIVEIYHDDRGIIWPETVSPFKVHLLSLKQDETAIKIYDQLIAAGVDVLFDDRDVSAGQKFAEADLLGLPWRLVISAKTGEHIEIKRRDSEKAELVDVKEVISKLK